MHRRRPHVSARAGARLTAIGTGLAVVAWLPSAFGTALATGAPSQHTHGASPRQYLAAQPNVVSSPAHTWHVNSTDDNGDNTPGDNVCADLNGHCTLRAAIEETNAGGGP